MRSIPVSYTHLKRRVVLHEGSPPFAAAVAAGPGTGCGERRPLPCRRLLSCRVRRGNCGFGRAVAGGSLVCGVSGRAAARTSGQYGATTLQEMRRVVVHGVLHLCGQGDKTPRTNAQMHRKEDKYLKFWEDPRQ